MHQSIAGTWRKNALVTCGAVFCYRGIISKSLGIAGYQD